MYFLIDSSGCLIMRCIYITDWSIIGTESKHFCNYWYCYPFEPLSSNRFVNFKYWICIASLFTKSTIWYILQKKKKRNALPSSATWKALKDHRRQLKWILSFTDPSILRQLSNMVVATLWHRHVWLPMQLHHYHLLVMSLLIEAAWWILKCTGQCSLLSLTQMLENWLDSALQCRWIKTWQITGCKTTQEFLKENKCGILL